MAAYNVDIAIALKNSNKLMQLRKELKAATDNQREFNKEASKTNGIAVSTFNKLNAQIARASKLLGRAAIGTASFNRAAKAAVAVEKEMNKQLQIKNGLLEKLRGNQMSAVDKSIARNERKRPKRDPRSGFKAFSQRADDILFQGQSSPAGGRIERILTLKRDEVRLQEALLSLEQRSAAKQNEKLQIQGELNRQTALAVNNVKLRGQFSPLTSDIRGNIGDIKSRRESNILSSRRNQFGNVFTGRSGRDFGQIGGRIGPVEPIRSVGGFLSFSKRADEIAKGVKANVKQTTKAASLLAQQSARAAFTDMEFGIEGGQIGPATPFTRAEKFGFGKRGQRAGGLFSFPGGRNARIKGGIGSAFIGGGFPALFGAGGISSVLGGVAGGAGGALAPGGGFAASIFATAIAAQIEKAIEFRKAIKKINDDLANMNIQSQFSRQSIKQLARDFDITNDEALKLAETIKTFGADRGLGLLRAFGSIETFKVLAGLQDTGSVLGKIEQLQGEISEEKRRELLQTLATKGPLETQLALEDAILEKSRKRNKEADKREKKRKEFERAARGGLGLESIIAANKAKEQTRFEGIATAAVFRDDNQVQREFLENTKLVNEQLRFLAEFRAPADELKEMLNPMRQILDLSVAIRDGFQESFSGIIKGTMTVGEAFRSMLNRIADHFLDTAARMAATQIQKGFLGLFSNMFNFGTTSRADQFLGGVANPFGGGGSSGVSFGSVDLGLGSRADGGPVKRGGKFIVGERGPELFTPGVSGMITPNHALGGSTSVVVNVDASGSSVEGDEQGGRELGRLISVAVQSEILQQKRPGGLLA